MDDAGNYLIPQIGSAFREYHVGWSWTPGNAISVTGVIDLGAFVNKINFKCVSRRSTANNPHSQWVCSIDWGAFDSNAFGDDVTQWPITVDFGGNRFEKVLFADVTTGNPIVNTAGQRFEEPCTADDSRVTFTVTRNEVIDVFGLTQASTYNDTLNLELWNNFPPKTVKLGIITGEGPFYDTNYQVWYYKVKYPFEVTRTDWQYHPLNEGFSYLSGGNLIRAKTYDGQNTPEPILLNNSGGPLGSNPPVFLAFDKYLAVDWTPLAIDLSKRLGT